MKNTIIALAFTAVAATAQFVGGIGYTNYSEDADNIGDINIGILYGSVGYEITYPDTSFTLVPEVRFGAGIVEDTVDISGVDVDMNVNTYISLLLSTKFDFGMFYGLANINYTYVDAEASALGVSFTSDEWGFGGGLGLGYNFSDTLAAEGNIEFYDGSTTYGGGIKFKF